MAEKMTNYYLLAHLFEVESKISLNTRVPLILKCSQVNLDFLKTLDVDHEIKNGCVVMYLKALVDTGSSETLVGDNCIGKAITDQGVHASVSSILDDNQSYKARVIKGFLQTGSVDLMIVPELTKPNNNILLMRMLSNILRIQETSKRNYNLDDEFLEKPVQIVIGAIDCQVEMIDMRKEGLKDVYFHPGLQLPKPKVGLNMPFHGCLGAQENDYMCPLIEYRPVINLESEHSLNEIDLQLIDVDLIRKLIGHLKSNHYIDPEMIRLSCQLQEILKEDVAVTNLELCRRPLTPGHVYLIHGERVPAPRCNFL